MYIKFISDEGPVTVETNSYKVYDNYTSGHKTIAINYIIKGIEDEPPRVEFLVGKGKNDYRSAFVMNNEGRTIDKIFIERTLDEEPEPPKEVVVSSL